MNIRSNVSGRLYDLIGYKDHDHLYREELERWAADWIAELYVAFSRLGDTKRYVQHDITQQANDVWSLLDGDGVVYVCGDGRCMEPDVRATLTANKRYNLDVWGST